MSPAWTRRLLSIHRWCGLIVSLNVALFAVTGAILIFHEEIDAALGVGPKASGAPETVSLAQAVELARAHKPGQQALYVFRDREEYPGAILVGMASTHRIADSKPLVIDSARGVVLDKVDLDDTFTNTILRLHAQLLLGPPGALLVGALGLAFLLSLATGVVLYGPMMRRFRFGMVRRDRHLRTVLADVHKLLGAVTFGWNLVVVATGILLSLGSLLLQLYTMTELAELARPYQSAPIVRELDTLDRALAAAERASGGRRWSFAALPGSDFASPRHYAVLLQGQEGLDQRMLTMALVDARAPEHVDHRQFPWYLRLLLISEPLHFGDYGGLPLKLLWLLFTAITLALTVSGVWVTFATRRERALRRREAPIDSAPQEASP